MEDLDKYVQVRNIELLGSISERETLLNFYLKGLQENGHLINDITYINKDVVQLTILYNKKEAIENGNQDNISNTTR